MWSSLFSHLQGKTTMVSKFRLNLMLCVLTSALMLSSLAACKKKESEEAAKPAASSALVPTTVPSVSGPTPTLAPMLERASPGVVNVSVEATVTAQVNPFFQDPLFRRFFNVPEQAPTQHVQAVGSGVVYDASHGYIITNTHVVENADKILITFADRREVTAKLVGTDPQTDLAVLQVDADKLTALPLGDSGKLRVGDYVVAIGNPFGVGQTATMGIVSALERSGLGIEGYEDFIQTDASINPGNSGGALLDLNGNLIGINTAILSRSGGNVGIGFAIPINMVKGVVAQLIATGKVARGELGVVIQDVTPPIAEAMGINPAGGAVISKVTPGSPAEKAGLQTGDVIVALDGDAVRTSSQLRNVIGSRQPGSKLNLTVLRKGNKVELTAVLDPIKEAKEQSAPDDSLLAGVKLGPIPADTPGADKIAGVYVVGVKDGSAADQADLQTGDIILSVNQQPVAAPKDVVEILKTAKGKPLLLNIQRGDAGLFIVIR